VRNPSAKKFPKTTLTRNFHSADGRRYIRRLGKASARSPHVHIRARGGCRRSKLETKPTGDQSRGALAPLTRRSKPNQTNQTHTIDGERGHDSSFGCALQLSRTKTKKRFSPRPGRFSIASFTPHIAGISVCRGTDLCSRFGIGAARCARQGARLYLRV